MEKLRKIGFSKLTPLDHAMEKLFSKLQLNPSEEVEILNALDRILINSTTFTKNNSSLLTYNQD